VPTPIDGLTHEQVAERRARGQVNDVSVVPSRTVGQIGSAGFGIAAIVWSFARLFLPPERRVGTGAPRARS
jgi:hypothetical protein